MVYRQGADFFLLKLVFKKHPHTPFSTYSRSTLQTSSTDVLCSINLITFTAAVPFHHLMCSLTIKLQQQWSRGLEDGACWAETALSWWPCWHQLAAQKQHQLWARTLKHKRNKNMTFASLISSSYRTNCRYYQNVSLTESGGKHLCISIKHFYVTSFFFLLWNLFHSQLLLKCFCLDWAFL